MNGAASELRNARSASKEIALDLTEIEEDILSEQSADSSYARLTEEIRTTKQKMTEAEKRLTESADFIHKYEQARATDGAPAAFRLRKAALANDLAYSLHKSTLTATRRQARNAEARTLSQGQGVAGDSSPAG